MEHGRHVRAAVSSVGVSVRLEFEGLSGTVAMRQRNVGSSCEVTKAQTGARNENAEVPV